MEGYSSAFSGIPAYIFFGGIVVSHHGISARVFRFRCLWGNERKGGEEKEEESGEREEGKRGILSLSRHYSIL